MLGTLLNLVLILFVALLIIWIVDVIIVRFIPKNARIKQVVRAVLGLLFLIWAIGVLTGHGSVIHLD